MPGRLALALSPAGHLLRSSVTDGAEVEPAVARRLERYFAGSSGAGLAELGAREVSTALPAELGFWRDFARRFVTALCSAPELEEQRSQIDVPLPVDELGRFVASAPPMIGGEYLTVAVLTQLWSELLAVFRNELAGTEASVQALLAQKSTAWNVVGKVHFHLAENPRNPERPFAFLASYTTGLSPQGKPTHRPLGDALRESGRDKARLLALLVPVQRAAGHSAFLKQLVDSGQVYAPTAWSTQDAYRFLKDASAIEQSGVVVRLPDWWRARRGSGPQVSIVVGGKEPSTLGLKAMLDFSAHLTVGGAELTEAEVRALRSQSEGLLLLKGKWVEVDREKLDQVLAHWRAVQSQVKAGVSFIEGMRLLAGAGISESTGDSPPREWSGAEAGPWLASTLAKLRSPDGDGADPGAALKAELRPYQREGVRWLWFLSQLKLGACLADDMGLGKTIQVLALLLLLKQRAAAKGPHLLVVPASLIANWQAEANRFAPSLQILVAHPSAMDSKSLGAGPPKGLGQCDLVITTYGTVHRSEWITAQHWGLCVLDEAQAIKNPGIKQTRAVKALLCDGRIALTGTPVENSVTDLWSIFDFLNPGLLGTAKELSRFIKRSESYGPLRELTRPYILRRLKTDRRVISDLPEKTEMRAFCTLSKRQAFLYQESVDSLGRELKNVDGIARRGLVLAYLVRFKQICNHPSHWLKDGVFSPDDSGKFQRLRELCEVVASRQEKALIFTQFRELAEPLAQWLTLLFGKPGLTLTGETPVKRRQELVSRFQEDEQLPFFVLSLKAGGTGLNLTAASHVIHFDRWWNPAVENQATDRAFRIGQKKNVVVHKFVCRGTIEERVDALLESKQGMANDLLGGGQEPRLTELDDAALLKMVSLDLHRAREED